MIARKGDGGEGANANRTGVEVLLDILRGHGVDTIFGAGGSSVIPLTDALLDAKDFRYVLTAPRGVHPGSRRNILTGLNLTWTRILTEPMAPFRRQARQEKGPRSGDVINDGGDVPGFLAGPLVVQPPICEVRHHSLKASSLFTQVRT
jgi:hypothetical protein